MKKIFFIAALAMGALTAAAQESNDYLPDGILAVEWKFNPFDYEAKPTNMAQITARMFMDERNAIRFTVGFGYNRDKDEQNADKDSRSVSTANYDIENSSTIVKNTETTLKLGLGYEYHFASAGRLDFFAGAEAGYLSRMYSATSETSATTTNVTTVGTTSTVTRTSSYTEQEYEKSNSDRTKFNEKGFYGTVFTGVDFYVYKKLYIGAELGLTFNTGKKANGTYTENKGGTMIVGSNETVNWTSSYSSETGLTQYVDHLNKNNNSTTADYARDNSGTQTKVYIEPAIRLGWMF